MKMSGCVSWKKFPPSAVSYSWSKLGVCRKEAAMRPLLASLMLIVCGRFAGAQDTRPSAEPQFEVAAIRRNVDASPAKNIGIAPGGRVIVKNLPVRFMIRFAYNVQDFQISGGPSWMNTDAYDINAKAPEIAGLQQIRPLLQTLLEDRFKLVVHHETKEVLTYELLPSKSGLKVTPSKDGSCVVPDPNNLPKPGEPLPHFCGNIGMRANLIEAYAVPMDRFVATLSTVLGRAVIDKTGIKRDVDIHLEFTPDEINGGPAFGPTDPAATPPVADLSRPSIFVAVQEQLGLKLETKKAPGDLLVVNQLERPSEN
jgi:uncharacterized protein (TIGR03435 family)